MFGPVIIKGVMVDRLKCQGTGYCVKIAPLLFKLEGEGPAEVLPDGIADVEPDLVFEAEDTCPTRAISVDR